MISSFLVRRIPRPKPPLKKDPQARKLYKMEREFCGTSIYHHVKRVDLLTILNHACRYYGVMIPKLTLGSNSKDKVFGRSYVTIHYREDDSVEFMDEHEIWLNRAYHGDNVAVLLHELAHHIVDQRFDRAYDHGKTYCAIYMHLLDKYRLLPSVCFRVLAKRRGIEIAQRFRPEAVR